MILTNPKVYTKYLDLKCYEQTIFKPKHQKVTALTLKSVKYEISFTFSPKYRMHYSIKDRNRYYRKLYTEIIPRIYGVIYGDLKQHLINISFEVTSRLVCEKWDKELSKIQKKL